MAHKKFKNILYKMLQLKVVIQSESIKIDLLNSVNRQFHFTGSNHLKTTKNRNLRAVPINVASRLLYFTVSEETRPHCTKAYASVTVSIKKLLKSKLHRNLRIDLKSNRTRIMIDYMKVTSTCLLAAKICSLCFICCR